MLDKEKERNIIVCRCEDITMGEIRDAITRGYHTVDDIKRLLRAGMGPCQGRGCKDIIIREIARATGKKFEDVPPGTYRQPAKPIKLGILAQEEK